MTSETSQPRQLPCVHPQIADNRELQPATHRKVRIESVASRRGARRLTPGHHGWVARHLNSPAPRGRRILCLCLRRRRRQEFYGRRPDTSSAQRSTRAPPPPARLSTSALLAMVVSPGVVIALSLIHISEPTRRTPISYAVFCLKKKKKNKKKNKKKKT